MNFARLVKRAGKKFATSMENHLDSLEQVWNGMYVFRLGLWWTYIRIVSFKCLDSGSWLELILIAFSWVAGEVFKTKQKDSCEMLTQKII